MRGLEWWSAGVSECWVGSLSVLTHYSTTPSLRYSKNVLCLFRLRRLDVFDLYIEVQRLARQRMIEVDDDGFFSDLVHAQLDGPPVGRFGHQHGAGVLRFGWNLFAGKFLKRLFVGHAIAVFRFDLYLFLVSDFQSVQFSF